MKSVIKGNVEDKQEGLVFPVLMENVKTSTVVLFTSEYGGIAVHTTPHSGDTKLGDYSRVWVPMTDNVWKKFTGTIELSN